MARLFFILTLALGLYAYQPCDDGVTIDFSSGAPLCTGGYELTAFDFNSGEGQCIKRQGGGSPVVLSGCSVVSQAYKNLLRDEMQKAARNAKAVLSKPLPVSISAAVPIPTNPPPLNLTSLLVSIVLIDDNFAKSVEQLAGLQIGGISFKVLKPVFNFYGGFFSDLSTYLKGSLNLFTAFSATYLFYALGLLSWTQNREQTIQKIKGISPNLAMAITLMFMPITQHSTTNNSQQSGETATQLLATKFFKDSVNLAYQLSVKLNNRYFDYLSERINMTVDDSSIRKFASKEASFNTQKNWIINAKKVCDTQVNCGDLNRYMEPSAYSCEFCAQVNKAVTAVNWADKQIPIQKQALQTAYDIQFQAHAETVRKIKEENNKIVSALGLFQVSYLPMMNVYLENSIANFKPEHTSLNSQNTNLPAANDTDEANYQNMINIQEAYLSATAQDTFWGKINSWFSGDEQKSSMGLPTTIERKKAPSGATDQAVGNDFWIKPFAAVSEAGPYFLLPGTNGIYDIVNQALSYCPDNVVPFVFEKLVYNSLGGNEDKGNGLFAHLKDSVWNILGWYGAIDVVKFFSPSLTNAVIQPMKLITAVMITSTIAKQLIAVLPLIALSLASATAIIMFIFDLFIFKLAGPFVAIYAFTMGDNGKIREYVRKGFSLYIWPFSLLLAVALAIIFNTLIDTIFVGIIKSFALGLYGIDNVLDFGVNSTVDAIKSKIGLIYFLSLSEVLGGVTKLFFGVYIVLKTHGHILEVIGLNQTGMIEKLSDQVTQNSSNLTQSMKTH